MILRTALTAFCLIGATGAAHANLIASASLYGAPFATGSSVVAVDAPGVTTPSQSLIAGTGYTVTFATTPDQGVVSGMSGAHAVPIAGQLGGLPTYLTGGFGSAQTTDLTQAGSYFSTGDNGSITVTFATAQTSLALLWGSIDAGNAVTLLDASNTVIDTFTGVNVQALASGFAGNGYQGAGGSAYVALTDSQAFTSVVFSSTVPSFEFAGVAASDMPFDLPEPAGLLLFAPALAMVWRLRGRRA